MRIMLVSPIVFAASGLLMGVLQSSGSFIAPAFAPALYQFGIMLGAILLSSAMGIYGVAVGVVIGSMLHLGIQLPSLRGTLRSRDASTHSQHSATIAPARLRPDLVILVGLMLPRVVGLGVTQFNFIVNTWIASGSGEGAVSSLALGFAILLLPIAAIAQSQGATLFPALSAHAARGEMDQFAARLARALGIVIALGAPATVGLIVLGYPLVRLLFQRGAFTEQSSRDVSLALAMFAVGLIGHCVLEVTTRGFYAIKDTARPVLVVIAGVTLNILLSFALAAAFAARGWPEFGGVALANSFATLAEALVMYAWLRRRAHLRASMRRRSNLGRALAKASLASLAMGGFILAWLQFAGIGWVGALGGLVAGVVTYFAFALALRSDEARDAAKLMLRRVSGLRAARNQVC
jgi:putative peptidoglycan lipid II flippase